MKKITLSILCLFLSYNIFAACTDNEDGTYTSADASITEINACITMASAGETVIVPTSTANWSTYLDITKSIVLQGAGVGSTVITSTGGSYMLVYTGSTDVDFRITGFTFDGGDRAVTGISINNSSTSVTMTKIRIDNNSIINCGTKALNFSGMIYGLVDNNTIDGALYYAGNDNYSWANAYTAGSANALYFEDNAIGGGDYLIQSCCGARWVMRYNDINLSGMSGGADFHGNQSYNTEDCSLTSNSRGVLGAEIYKNDFTNANGGVNIVDARGGQFLVWGNTSNNTYGLWQVREEDNNDIGGCYPVKEDYPGWDPVHDSYMFLNTTSDGVWRYDNADTELMIVEKQEYWADTQDNSTSATTYFTKDIAANRPGTCADDDVYWETNNLKLYRCDGANNWVEVYVPYQYPYSEDTTSPTISSTSVNGSTVTVTWNETVVTTAYDADLNMDCSTAGANIALNSPTGTGATRTLTAATPVAFGDTCNIDVVDTNITDAAETPNAMETVSDVAVTNNTADVAKQTGRNGINTNGTRNAVTIPGRMGVTIH